MPDYVLLSVDNSLSLYNAINDYYYSYDEFKRWLGTEYPNAHIEARDGLYDFTDERWIYEMSYQLQSILDDM